MKKIAILGSGAWGTALGVMAVGLGHKVMLYGRDPQMVEAINSRHVNPGYLPDITLPPQLIATTDAGEALEKADIVFAVIPAQAFSNALKDLAPLVPKDAPMVLCAKGIERETGRFMSDVAHELLPGNPLAALSGPSFADDVARGLPTAVTLASSDLKLSQKLSHFLSGPRFRCYSSDDLMGVEVGGALKNVLALAAGAARGRGLGASAEAALVTRGFAELRRIGTALGGKQETMSGLSVLGDLILTCSSPQSRNFSYGVALGRGDKTEGLRLAEGVATAPIAAKICEKHAIPAPIIHAVVELLAGKIQVDEAVNALITRPLKSED